MSSLRAAAAFYAGVLEFRLDPVPAQFRTASLDRNLVRLLLSEVTGAGTHFCAARLNVALSTRSDFDVPVEDIPSFYERVSALGVFVKTPLEER